METLNNEISYKEISSCTIEDVEEISKRLKSQVSESVYNDVSVLVAIVTHLGYSDGVSNTLKGFENLMEKLNVQ